MHMTDLLPRRRGVHPAMARIRELLLPLLLGASSLPGQAAAIDVPFVTDFGCSVVQWLRGPLAILIFVTVVVGTLVLGMITRMQWDRIITICVIFGILVGLGSILSSSSYIQNIGGMSACLQ
ncbi:MAG: hypothetical protein JWQ76_3876 [Ramlibacter sp.]|nr:hypothetical protein [Ramlibacter sp.]